MMWKYWDMCIIREENTEGALVKGPDSSFITYEIDSYAYKEHIPLENHIKYVGKYFYTDDYSGPYSDYTYYYANYFS